MPTYLVAYDISSPRRLRKVARQLEKVATRIQYSVFLLKGEREKLDLLLQRLAPLVHPHKDVLQAWELPRESASKSQTLGTLPPTHAAALVVGEHAQLFVVRSPRASRRSFTTETCWVSTEHMTPKENL